MARKPHVNDYVRPPNCPFCRKPMVDARGYAKFQCWPPDGCGIKIEFNAQMVARLRDNPEHPKWGRPRRFHS